MMLRPHAAAAQGSCCPLGLDVNGMFSPLSSSFSTPCCMMRKSMFTDLF